MPNKYYDINGVDVATVVYDNVPAQIAVSPTSATIPPSGTRRFTVTISSAGGRPLPGVFPTSVIIDDVGFSYVDNGDGTIDVTAGSGSNGLASPMRVLYAPNSLTSADVSLSCTAFSGRTAAATAILDSIVSGGAGSMKTVSHYVPGVTPENGSSIAQEIGWWEFGNWALVDNPAATYGKVKRSIMPSAFTADIATFTKSAGPGLPTILTITGGTAGYMSDARWSVGSRVTASDGHVYQCIVSHGNVAVAQTPSDSTNEPGVGANWQSFWYRDVDTGSPAAWSAGTIYTQGPWMQIKNYNGDGLATLLPAAFVTMTLLPDGVTAVLAFDSSTTSRPDIGPVPSADQAQLRFSGGIGSAVLLAIPDQSAPQAFGDVMYKYHRAAIGDSYACNDGAGAQKGLFHFLAGEYGSSQGQYSPFWIGDNTNEAGPVQLWVTNSYVNLVDGVADPLVIAAGGKNYQLQNPTLRGALHTNESIVRFPAVEGDQQEEWHLVDGVLLAHYHIRVYDANSRQNVPWVAVVLDLNNTMGGGGSLAPIESHIDTDEIYMSLGYTSPDRQADHLRVYCEEGSSVPAGSPFHIIIELQDAANRRMYVPGGWADTIFGGQTRYNLEITKSGPITSFLGGFGGGDAGLGRRRYQVTPSGTGTISATFKLKELINNDKWSGLTWDGSISLTVF